MLAAKRDSNVFVIYFDGEMSANGAGAAELTSLVDRYGQRFIYFGRDHHRYVIRDLQALARIEALYAPQSRLGEQQSELGRKQSALGRRQSELGREQGELGREQGREDSASPHAKDLVRRQNELAREQNELAEQQNRLGAEQSRLGEKQNELGREAMRKSQPILDEAIRNGIAVEVR
jgi:hypothetical protein